LSKESGVVPNCRGAAKSPTSDKAREVTPPREEHCTMCTRTDIIDTDTQKMDEVTQPEPPTERLRQSRSGKARGLPPIGPRKRQYDPSRHCGAVTSSDGSNCCLPRSFRTQKLRSDPDKRCFLHGGNAPSALIAASRRGNVYGVPIKSGSFGDALEKVRKLRSERPLELFPELLQLRGVVQAFIDSRDEATAQFRAWLFSFNAAVTDAIFAANSEKSALALKACKRLRRNIMNQRPFELYDVSRLSEIIESVGRTVQRIFDMQQRTSLTWEQVTELFDRIGVITARRLSDQPELLQALAKDWESIDVAVIRQVAESAMPAAAVQNVAPIGPPVSCNEACA
jgi:hypothetical protein